MLLRTIGDPDFIFKFPSLLTLFMFIWAGGIQTGIELARDLGVSKFAVRGCAVSTVAAQWHCRMFKWTSGICTIREVFAVHFGLVCNLLSWGWMPTSTLPVLASSTKGTNIINIDSCARGCGWRLMCEFAVLVRAGEVVFARVVCRRGLPLLLRHLYIHGR